MHSKLQCLALLLIGVSVVAVDVTIDVETGTPKFKVLGEQDDGVNFFYGIPFSKPRVPPHRYELPEEYIHEADEVYDAKDQKHECVPSSPVNATGHKLGHWSEDCLYLDIYMPASIDTPASKIVMVWIHGGSWMSGSKNEYSLKFWAKEQWIDGAENAVGVAVNYRLNILGFPDLDGVPLNLAMYDNIAALTWVQKHIGNFGGDKDHVTIFGESAGSMQTLQLWASPAAQDLFAGAISQSPYVWSYETGQATPMKTRGAKRAIMATCMEVACAKHGAGCGFQTPAIEDLIEAGCFGYWFGPVGDHGATISDHLHKDICQHDIPTTKPLLVGHNSLEINLWTLQGAQMIKKNQMLEWITHFAPHIDNQCAYEELGHQYEATGLMQNPAMNPTMANPFPDTPATELYATSGIFFNMLAINLMHLPNVHMFVFNESAKHMSRFPLCNNPYGAHSCEISFVLTQPAQYDPNSEKGTQNVAGGDNLNTVIQANMRKVWATFALSGTPGWSTDEIGVFMDDQLITREALFDPDINVMLTQLMCHPHEIPEHCGSHEPPMTYECGDIKELYKKQGCCGMPTKTFELPHRRLSAAGDMMTPAHHECGDIKELYKDNGCCGMPTKTFEFPHRRLSTVPGSTIAKSNEPSRAFHRFGTSGR